ncbi:serine/threonine-protein kinase Kist-like isoform X1 [Actinia tenebrosa]|uniref:Serine/threonine-protein kinase Kist-like isoform X1 n=1 Tax=Actinia tenebrosa TaxID=6105 RepID=A0A6P8IRH0_ACTTE|nr:serine/threonine-protein kinase Kist-like isoform X1 [Actinia tenebrosa]
MELEPGDILEGSEEKWEVLRFLGKGKCCSVFEARLEGEGLDNERRAALKFYKKEEKYTSAGMNEAQILQKIHSEDESSSYGRCFVVKLLDVFSCDGYLCLINPLLSCSLYHILTKGSWENGLPMYVVQKCCRDLAGGIEYLRQKHIVHGDIKPTNIMWDSKNEVFQFVDFGLSFTEGQQPAQQIQSPGFQAPEAQEWNKNVLKPVTEVPMCSSACDTWSMACVLFLLHTGQSLFQVDSHLSIICHACHQDHPVDCIHGKEVTNQLLQHSSQNKDVFSKNHLESMTDLLIKMVKCRPDDRITPSEILDHSFLSPQLTITNPSLVELLFLPTRVLLLTNMFENTSELNQSDEYEDFIDDIKEECSRFGVVKSVRIPCVEYGSTNTDLLGKVFVEFENTQDCEECQRCLTGRIFNQRTVITSFYPFKKYKDLVH